MRFIKRLLVYLILMGVLPVSEAGFVHADSAEQQKKKKKKKKKDKEFEDEEEAS